MGTAKERHHSSQLGDRANAGLFIFKGCTEVLLESTALDAGPNEFFPGRGNAQNENRGEHCF